MIDGVNASRFTAKLLLSYLDRPRRTLLMLLVVAPVVAIANPYLTVDGEITHSPDRCFLDRTSGLIWTRPQQSGGPYGEAARYTWYEPDINIRYPALDKSTYAGIQGPDSLNCGLPSCDTKSITEHARQMALCGAVDWSLPTTKQLLDLLESPFLQENVPQADSGPKAANQFWTIEEPYRTRPGTSPKRATHVNLKFGTVSTGYAKDNPLRVLLVANYQSRAAKPRTTTSISGQDESGCQRALEEYFETYEDALSLQYSPVNVNATRAVYYAGKPADDAFNLFGDIWTSSILPAAAGGGPASVLAALVVAGGKEVGLRILAKTLKTPQAAARAIAAQAMKQGMDAMNKNYRQYTKGLAAAERRDQLAFISRQVYVNAMGEAKTLYHASREMHIESAEVSLSMADIVASVEEIMTESAVVDNALMAARIADILDQQAMPLLSFTPYKDFVRSISIDETTESVMSECGSF